MSFNTANWQTFITTFAAADGPTIVTPIKATYFEAINATLWQTQRSTQYLSERATKLKAI